MSVPPEPLQITSFFLECLTKSPEAVTLLPFAIRPVSAVLSVHPTPVPWSARQAQMSSRTELLALSTKLTWALPAAAPPTRKNTSDTTSGLSGALPVGPAVPSERRLREGSGPAANIGPED